MDDLLQLIGERKTEKILSHQKFPNGIHELIRQGYVVVTDENFILTPKGELARIEGLKPVEHEDQAQLRRNTLNKSITELPNGDPEKDKKAIYLLILAFLIFIMKYLSTQKIMKSKFKPKWWKK